MSDLKLEDILDINLLQQFQDTFADATGVASLITTPDGTPVTRPSNFCALCAEIIRKTPGGLHNCMLSDAELGKQSLYEARIQPCLSGGLWDAGVSINAEGMHLGNWMIGQIRTKDMNTLKMLEYADKIGADRGEFLNALNYVPVMSIEQFRNVSKMLFLFVNQLTDKAISNVHLKKIISNFQTKEKELGWERAQMNALMNNISDHIYFKDMDSRFIRCNVSHARWFGLDNPEQIIGKTDFDYFSEEHASNAYNDEQAIIKEGITISKEEKETWPNRPDTWASTIKTPFFDNSGSIIGTFGISRNITEKKKIEETLVESEQRLRTIIENMGEGLAIITQKMEFIFANPRADEIFGQKINGLVGLNLMDFVDKNEINLTNEKLNSRNKSEKSIYEVNITRPDGKKRTLIISSVPRKDHNGNFAGFYEVFTDITDRKRAEKIIKEKNNELQLINAQKDKLFSIIAHDLKSPFNSFLGLTEIMEKELFNLSLTQVQEMAANMKNSATKIYNLLTNLLEWSRLQRGLIQAKPVQLNLKEQINQYVNVLTEMAKRKSIRIKVKISDDLLIFADPNMLQIIIQNLLSNAIKFTPDKGIIVISGEVQNSKIAKISITDSGIGMDHEIVSNLFKIDAQVSRPGTNGESSTGLGLILCKEFIEKQGGKIEVESVVGKGSTFSFTIPLP
jgi:PAS domain S-box-containing protein